MVDKEVYIENKLEYNRFLLSPEIQNIYKEITKDLALGNLNNNELLIKGMIIEIIDILILYPHLFNKSLESFLRDLVAGIQLTRSRGGFEAKLQRSNISDNEQRIIEGKDKKPLLR